MALVNALGAITLEATQQSVKTAVETGAALATAGVRGVRRDADTSPVADGAPHVLTTNAVGRLKTSSWPGAYALTTGTITTSSSVVSVDVSRVSNATVELVGTFTGVSVAFESSLDGTNWKAEQGLRSNGVAIESTGTALATGVAYTWEFSVNGKNFFRARATAYTSGTATVNIAFGAFATEPFVSTPTHSVQQSGVWTMTPFTPTAFLLTSAATTNATLVKASAGNLYEVSIANFSGTTCYFKLYNKASAPTVGTDIPILTIQIATGTSFITDFGTVGKRFTTGISYAVTAGTGLAADTTVAAAGVQISGSYA